RGRVGVAVGPPVALWWGGAPPVADVLAVRLLGGHRSATRASRVRVVTAKDQVVIAAATSRQVGVAAATRPGPVGGPGGRGFGSPYGFSVVIASSLSGRGGGPRPP